MLTVGKGFTVEEGYYFGKGYIGIVSRPKFALCFNCKSLIFDSDNHSYLGNLGVIVLMITIITYSLLRIIMQGKMSSK